MLKRYFTIIDRYISKELLLTWLAVTLVLMLILLSGTLARLLGKAADGSIPGDAVWSLMGFTSARYLILLIPLSLYLGVLLCFSRLYKDNEMAAMGACGIGLMRLYRPLLMVTIPAAGILMYLTLFVMPWVAQQADTLKTELENRSELTGLTAGRFNESKKGDAIMFLQSQSDDKTYMNNVFMHQTDKTAKNKHLDNVESADVARRYRDEEGRNFIFLKMVRHMKACRANQTFVLPNMKRKVFIYRTRKFKRKAAVKTRLKQKHCGYQIEQIILQSYTGVYPYL